MLSTAWRMNDEYPRSAVTETITDAPESAANNHACARSSVRSRASAPALTGRIMQVGHTPIVRVVLDVDHEVVIHVVGRGRRAVVRGAGGSRARSRQLAVVQVHLVDEILGRRVVPVDPTFDVRDDGVGAPGGVVAPSP